MDRLLPGRDRALWGGSRDRTGPAPLAKVADPPRASSLRHGRPDRRGGPGRPGPGAGDVHQLGRPGNVTELVFHVYPRHRVEEADRPMVAKTLEVLRLSPEEAMDGDGRRITINEARRSTARTWPSPSTRRTTRS